MILKRHRNTGLPRRRNSLAQTGRHAQQLLPRHFFKAQSSCPHADGLCAKHDCRLQYRLEPFLLSGPVIGAVRKNLNFILPAGLTDAFCSPKVARRHMNVSAPFNSVQAGLFYERDHVLRAFLPKCYACHSRFDFQSSLFLSFMAALYHTARESKTFPPGSALGGSILRKLLQSLRRPFFSPVQENKETDKMRGKCNHPCNGIRKIKEE